MLLRQFDNQLRRLTAMMQFRNERFRFTKSEATVQCLLVRQSRRCQFRCTAGLIGLTNARMTQGISQPDKVLPLVYSTFQSVSPCCLPI